MTKSKRSPKQLDREIAAALSARKRPIAAALSARKRPASKSARATRRASSGKLLVVEYDVTGLSEDQIDMLTGYTVVQGEESDTYDVGHPGVKVTSQVLKRGRRKLLVVGYDLTGLSEDQIDALTGEALAQAEQNDPGLIIDGVPQNVVYPSVPVTSKII